MRSREDNFWANNTFNRMPLCPPCVGLSSGQVRIWENWEFEHFYYLLSMIKAYIRNSWQNFHTTFQPQYSYEKNKRTFRTVAFCMRDSWCKWWDQGLIWIWMRQRKTRAPWEHIGIIYWEKFHTLNDSRYGKCSLCLWKILVCHSNPSREESRCLE